MKTPIQLIRLSLLALAPFLATQGHAQTFSQDPLSYTGTPASGWAPAHDGGTGWTTSWNGPAGHNSATGGSPSGGPLTYAFANGDTIGTDNTSDIGVISGGTYEFVDNFTAGNPFTAGAGTQTVWVSALMDIPSAQTGSSAILSIGGVEVGVSITRALAGATYAQYNNDYTAAIDNGTTNFSYITTNGAALSASNGNLGVNSETTTLVVLELSMTNYNGTSAASETAKVWINPTGDTIATLGTATGTATYTGTSNTGLAPTSPLFETGTGAVGTAWFGDVAIGSAGAGPVFADLDVVPEPSSWMLLGLGGLALMVGLRKSKQSRVS